MSDSSIQKPVIVKGVKRFTVYLYLLMIPILPLFGLVLFAGIFTLLNGEFDDFLEALLEFPGLVLLAGFVVIGLWIWEHLATPKEVRFEPSGFNWVRRFRTDQEAVWDYTELISIPVVAKLRRNRKTTPVRYYIELNGKRSFKLPPTLFPAANFTTVHAIARQWGWQGHFEPVETGVSPSQLGHKRPFKTYFTRQSAVEVDSIDEIIDWLKTCRYQSDPVQFGKRDYWMHPMDFEQTKLGDCEDHAIWAWRKLLKLDIEAFLVIGYWRTGGHAWVEFIDPEDGTRQLLESVGKRELIFPIERRDEDYGPYYAIDRSFKVILFECRYTPS